MAECVNSVVLTGNLTKDPDLRYTASSTAVCHLRLAVNTRRKLPDGSWGDKANYFDVTVWGKHGENCATYLSKGKPVAIQGRLEWREWTGQDGAKRQSVEVVADVVQFLRGREDGDGGGQRFTPETDVPADTAGLPGSGGALPGAADDDIPF